jgi:hypothetical protein
VSEQSLQTEDASRRYDYVPQLQADKIVAAAKAARTSEEEAEEE